MTTLSAKRDQTPSQVPAVTTPAPGKETTIGKLEATMDTMAYGVLLDLFAWATLWDDIYNERAKMDESTMRSMVAPFIGFGQHPAVWQLYSTAITPLVQQQISEWFGDEAYRNANSMTWLVVKVCAPTLAAQTKGWESAQQAHQILREAGGRL